MAQQLSLCFSNSVEVIAKPKGSTGFFGLTELETFTKLQVEPYANTDSPTPTLILDFSAVMVWDISALLWLVVALEHYRRNEGLSFLLKLPDDDRSDNSARSADYLRRWRFDKGLQIIDFEVCNLLIPTQKDYFNPPEPRRYFLEEKAKSESGLLDSLISRRLAEIRSLSDNSLMESVPISSEGITDCIKMFQAERIGDILKTQCGIEKRKADLFADQLITEALLNIQDHPNATIGLIAISLMGNTNELILSVVDNGDSIPQTIYKRYLHDTTIQTIGSVWEKSDESFEHAPYDRNKMSLEEKIAITHHATQKGVTRKKGSKSNQAGMGLTYIKEDSIGEFNGKLTIITDHLKMTYKGNVDLSPETSEWFQGWRGNLLRIAIPLRTSSL